MEYTKRYGIWDHETGKLLDEFDSNPFAPYSEKEKWKFFMVWNAAELVLSKKITDKEFRIFVHLCDKMASNGFIYEQPKTLAAQLGISVNHIYGYLRNLADSGCLLRDMDGDEERWRVHPYYANKGDTKMRMFRLKSLERKALKTMKEELAALVAEESPEYGKEAS